MTLMTVFEIPVIPVVIPLVQVAHMTDGIGMEMFHSLFIDSGHITAYRTGGLRVQQQLADNGQISRSPIAGHPMIPLIGDILVLRRGTRCRNQLSGTLRIGHQPLLTELRRPFHQRIGHLS